MENLGCSDEYENIRENRKHLRYMHSKQRHCKYSNKKIKEVMKDEIMRRIS